MNAMRRLEEFICKLNTAKHDQNQLEAINQINKIKQQIINYKIEMKSKYNNKITMNND
jgi:hypothetical protein